MLVDNPVGVMDKELVLRCQQGDSTAFRPLYQRYEPRVRSTLYQLCGQEMLDDLVQEVFLRVWKGLPTLRQVTYFSTWLYRISWNVATDRRRQFVRHPASVSEDSTLTQSLCRFQDTPDLMQLHYQDLVQRALQILSLEHRAVLVLHDLEDVPQKDVAKVLNLPLGTVKSRLFYARNQVRQFLEQQGV